MMMVVVVIGSGEDGYSGGGSGGDGGVGDDSVCVGDEVDNGGDNGDCSGIIGSNLDS